ncbi:hypothetical protein [Paenibacillus sp. MER TA 81-3]|uniref:hypothetical protein n=1 Tax=Paenibacillus sp. MER TA 81-3 TaxID=2939573 RepID=UPI00203D87BE|nr:hypothetical protein [Paenibacillus sp. MER TA 81-3]
MEIRNEIRNEMRNEMRKQKRESASFRSTPIDQATDLVGSSTLIPQQAMNIARSTIQNTVHIPLSRSIGMWTV